MSAITVVKRDPQGEESWRYSGRTLARNADRLLLEAHFDRPDMPFLSTVLRRGDRFVETFYTDRWYNIFEVHDRDDDRIKGWYCNIGRPAVFEAGDRVSYVDLALDLWVAPDGTQTVLDRDEFEALSLSDEDRGRALAALRELQEGFKTHRPPWTGGL